VSTTGGLIGRDEVLAVLGASFEQAASGQGHLVLIGGEAGIGKTAVAVAAADRAAATGALVLWGRCSETEGMPAFWPWAQVVRAVADAGTRPPEVLDALGWARSASDEPADVAASGSTASRARFRLFEAMAGFLAAVAGSRPVVVVVEDLHWADPDSLALADFSARHLVGQRVLLVGTYRDEEATEPLRHLAGSASLIPLGGLPPADVCELMARLLGRAPGEEEARRMWDRTAGNPLFVRELTRLATARGATGGTGLAAPGADSVRAVIERRLARLPQDCVHTLAAASLDAPVLRPSFLQRAVGVDVGAHLEQAVVAGVLVRAGSELRFAHDLFREVLADGLTAHARAGLHLRLVRALEEQHAAGGVAHPAELAAHYCAVAVTNADPALRSAAVRHSRAAAADAAARLAFADATAHLERALPLADTDSAERADVLLALAEARRKAGRLARARATYLDAAALAQAGGDYARLARAAFGLHTVGAKTGPSAEREQAIALLQQAADAPGLTGDLAALINAALARDLHHSLDASRTRQARQLAHHAVTLARGSGDRWALAHCLIAAHDVGWWPGSARERLIVLDELLALARQLPSAELTAQARLLRATALLELGDPAAHAELDLFCRESEQLGDAAARWDAQSRRAAAALLTGRLDEAGTLIGAAGQAAEDMGSADGVWIHDIQRWELARFQAGRGSYQRWHPGAEPPVETWPPWLALQAAEAGDLERAAAVMAGFPMGQSDGPGATTGYDLWFPSIAAEAAARCGTSDQRTRLYQRLSPLAGTQVVCGAAVAYAGAVDHYLGLLAASLGELSAAAAHLTAAAVQHHRLGATAWAQLSAQEQARLGQATPAAAAANRFQRDGAVWHITYHGKTIRMPDAKGLRDIATLLARPREPVPSTQLAGLVAPPGADPVLDNRARAAYQARLAELDQDIDDATADNDPERAARAAAERDSLVSELTRALGLGGRSRRLGDDTDRARKAVTARIGHAIDRLQRYHPDLAAHLRASIRTGTACSYQPAQPIDWNLLTTRWHRNG
jgi:tetratricopeptide (TPR) repeat protein